MLRILEETAKTGHQVELITLSMDKTCRSILPQNIKFFEIAPWLSKIKNHYLQILLEHLLVYRITKFIPKDIDLVVFHKSSSLPALYYFKKIMKKTIPTIYFSFEPPRFAYDLKNETLPKLGPLGLIILFFLPIIRYLDKKFAVASDEITTYSIFMKNWLETIYKRPIRNIIPLGVDPEMFENLKPNRVREKYHLLSGEKIVLTANKLHHRKRIHLLIQAMVYVKEKIPNVKALILGTGPDENKLKELTKKLHLEKTVIFCGHIGKEIPDYYASADVYAHPGKNEPFGLSVIEAQIAGVPVVSVREGEPLNTIIENNTGIFCNAEPEDMADKILTILMDEKKRRDMGKKAREHIKNNYTWEKTTQKFIDVCQKVR